MAGSSGGNGAFDGGVFTDSVVNNQTVTVGAAEDFTTLQAAIDFFNNKYAIDCFIEIADFAADRINENLNVDSIRGNLTIRPTSGNRFDSDGLCYLNNAPILSDTANAGVLAHPTGIAITGDTIDTLTFVASGGTNPDFDALNSRGAGVQRLRFRGAGNSTTVVTSFLNNTITAPAFSITPADNQIIGFIPKFEWRPSDNSVPSLSINNPNTHIKFENMYIWNESGTAEGAFVINDSKLEFKDCLFSAGADNRTLRVNGKGEIIFTGKQNGGDISFTGRGGTFSVRDGFVNYINTMLFENTNLYAENFYCSLDADSKVCNLTFKNSCFVDSETILRACNTNLQNTVKRLGGSAGYRIFGGDILMQNSTIEDITNGGIIVVDGASLTGNDNTFESCNTGIRTENGAATNLTNSTFITNNNDFSNDGDSATFEDIT